MEHITLVQAVVQAITQLAPTFLVFVVVALIFSWIRLVVDAMSGRGL